MTQETLNKVKVILGESDNIDDLLTIYMDNAIDYIFDKTGLKEIPETLYSVVVAMTVFQYRQLEIENVTSESKGSLSESFVTDYPSTITDRLDSHKRVTVV